MSDITITSTDTTEETSMNSTISNETHMPDLSSYVRANTDATGWQLNRKVDPTIQNEDWIAIPYPVMRMLRNTGDVNQTIGSFVLFMSEHMANIERRLADAIQRNADLQNAIQTINEHLADEADSRGWCSEFDDFVDNVNRAISAYGVELHGRKREYELDYQVQIDGMAIYSSSATVEASNEEEAWELLAEYPDLYGIDLMELALEYVRYSASITVEPN